MTHRKMELDAWSFQLSQLFEQALAPNGYREDRIYGEIAVRNALTRDTINELFFKTVTRTMKFKQDVVKYVTNQSASSTVTVNKILAELNEVKWYQFSKASKLRAKLGVAVQMRDSWHDIVVWLRSQGPGLEDYYGKRPPENESLRETLRPNGSAIKEDVSHNA